jgi:hypothetical protein
VQTADATEAATHCFRVLQSSLISVLASATILSGCASDSDPFDPNSPPDTATYQEHRGQLISTGLRELTDGLTDPNWVFLNNSTEIAYVTGTGWEGGGKLWFRDLETTTSVQLMDGLNVIQEVQYAADEGRIYLGQWHGLISVKPDGTDPVTHETDADGTFRVSPNGRHLLFRRASERRVVLMDRAVGDTTVVDLEPAYTRMSNQHAVFPVESGDSEAGVGVMDFAADKTLTTSGLGSYFPVLLIGVGGPPEAPRLSVIGLADDAADVVTFIGNPTTGTGIATELLHIPGDSVWASPIDAVKGGTSPDGGRIAVSVTRDLISGCFGSPCRFLWDIVLIDVTTRAVSVVARGISGREPMGIVFSPDGSRLLYETDGELYLVEFP